MALKKAIRENFAHYEAYLLLTNIHLKSNQLDEAMEAVTKAHLLNRNSPEIISLLKKVFKYKTMYLDLTIILFSVNYMILTFR